MVEMAKQRVHGQLRRQSFVNLSLQPSSSGRQNSKGPLSKTFSVCTRRVLLSPAFNTRLRCFLSRTGAAGPENEPGSARARRQVGAVRCRG